MSAFKPTRPLCVANPAQGSWKPNLTKLTLMRVDWSDNSAAEQQIVTTEISNIRRLFKPSRWKRAGVTIACDLGCRTGLFYCHSSTDLGRAGPKSRSSKPSFKYCWRVGSLPSSKRLLRRGKRTAGLSARKAVVGEYGTTPVRYCTAAVRRGVNPAPWDE